MKKAAWILAALALLLSGVGQAKAGLVVYTSLSSFEAATTGLVDTNFNGIVPPGSFTDFPTPPGFTSPTTGVNFNIANPVVGGGDNLNVTSATYYAPTIYPQDFLVPSAGTYNSTIEEVITLPTPVRAIGLDRGTFNGASLSYTFSTGDTYLDSSPPTFGSTSFVGFVASSPISSVTITYSSSDALVIDDFKAGQVVPEPSTLALFGIGACCVGGAAWRRRK